MKSSTLAATVAAVAVTGAALYALSGGRSAVSGARREPFPVRLKRYMEADLENLIITWKRQHTDGSFEQFMREHFPENAKVVGGQVILDKRVQGDAWRGRFDRLHASTVLHVLGPVPEEN